MYFFRRTFLAFKTRIFLQFRAKKCAGGKSKAGREKSKKKKVPRAGARHFFLVHVLEKYAQER
jgi:hypothetical protein